MRQLTKEEISKLASRKGVRKVAVENFLATMGTDQRVATSNLWLDRDSYNWNSATVEAILKGIELASKGEKND
jgi:hypothetical protein